MQTARIALRKHVAEGYRGLLAAETFLNGGGSGVPRGTLDLVRLRVSQINGCAFCVEMHSREAREAGETDRRLHTVTAWRETPYFTAAERAALALAEAATRIADNPEGVPQPVWDEAARHYDEPALASLVLAIAAINAWNRLNVATRTPAPEAA
ncbi:carboxymuconolactone decarboxylase family protein [Streptomyces sp. URMC 129]|uniref:carboxymuconolactone decarboxylase family protein n=1 Tax=Streptomyces sp. URMC 129 TaxID=3423407 RepID=UPI003F1C0BBC